MAADKFPKTEISFFMGQSSVNMFCFSMHPESLPVDCYLKL